MSYHPVYTHIQIDGSTPPSLHQVRWYFRAPCQLHSQVALLLLGEKFCMGTALLFSLTPQPLGIKPT